MNMELLKQYAMKFVNIPYIWGGETPFGYDCSGFVQEILAAAGIDFKGDETAQMIYNNFKRRAGTKDGVRELGSLCFYGRSTSSITHIAWALDGETMIEAGGGGSRTKTPDDSKKHDAFIRVRPIERRRDLVAVLLPKY